MSEIQSFVENGKRTDTFSDWNIIFNTSRNCSTCEVDVTRCDVKYLAEEYDSKQSVFLFFGKFIVYVQQ